MKKALFIDAVGMIDTDLLEAYVLKDQKLRSSRTGRGKAKRYLVALFAAAVAMLLCVALLVTSLPLIYVFNAQEINAAVSEGMENILFPLDKETDDGEEINTEDLLINWVEWKFAEEFFASLGAGTEDSVIDKLQSMQSSGLAGESMQSLGDFLAKLYEYYLKYKDGLEHPEENDSTEQTTDEQAEDTTQAGAPTKHEYDSIVYERAETDEFWRVTEIRTTTEVVNGDGIIEILGEIEGLPVTVIAESAAYTNVFIKELVMPDSITDIEASAFNYCTQLHTVKWSENLTKIGESAFVQTDLRELVLPDSVQSIGTGAFAQCDRLKSAVLPTGATEISEMCFANCPNLNSVLIPDTYTRISRHAFAGCGSLQTVVLPSMLEEIYSGAFADSSLVSVEVPDSVTYMDDEVFYACRFLQSVKLSAQLDSVPAKTFSNCSALIEVVLPTLCTNICSGAFNYCESLESMVLPDSVTKIESYAFGGCSSLKQIQFSQSLQYIFDGAFANCSALESAILPEGLQEIGRNAFYKCSAMKELYLPSTLRIISHEAFVACTLLSMVAIPDHVEEMGERAFMDCTGLQSAYVPAFKQEYEGPFELFMGCYSLKNVTFGEGFDAWDLCTGIFTNTGFVEITLPDTVDVIDSRVFQNCANLERVYLPKNIRQIVTDAFSGCANLKAMYYQGTVAEFEANVEVGGRSIPSGVRIICADGDIVID